MGGGRRTAGTDDGFTLIEVLVSIALISMMTAALTSFFVNTGSTNDQQTAKQMAIQLTEDATERVRAMKGSGITEGRDKASSDTQWAAPATGVAPYLSDMQETWDANASFPEGASATLPTSPVTVQVNNLNYNQHWYIGSCWQPLIGGECERTKVPGYAAFFRVVVAVTWPEKHCTSGTCSYVSSTLVSAVSVEPVFNPGAGALAPALENPGTQVAEVGVAATLEFSATGGAPPLTWTATGLPAGLSAASGGLVSGTPTTAGTYTVTATVTDGFNLIGSTSFSWVVNPKPVVTNPGSQTSQGGVADSLTLAVTGGTAPMTWSVTTPGPWGSTGLPPGLALNAATGVISGVPTTSSSTAKNVTVTVTTALGGTSSATFSWAVPVLSLQNPGNQADETSATVTQPVVAAGGVQPYTWKATGLPPGLSIGSAGIITGVPKNAGPYAVTVTVTDAAGTSLSVGFTWTITVGPNVTAPTAGTRNDAVGATISLASAANSGSGGYVWSATNLPGGLSINSSTGLISGKITTGTRYFTTITVVDSMGGTDSFTFNWNVSASGTTLRVTNPNGDRNDNRGTSVSFSATATGGSGFSWTATGLPAGITLTSGGLLSGTPNTVGDYTVTLVVRNSAAATATFMFVWRIK
jgi:prepilin-type N-terminal cleavage/methylation domain-containing protein